jgi:hypothetical protein
MFGFNEEQFAWFGLTIGIGAFMLYIQFWISLWIKKQKSATYPQLER